MSEEHRKKYAIINDIECPEPNMIAQYVDEVGYCYLDRRYGKPMHDGMSGAWATSVMDFGFVWTDNPDGTVSFYRSNAPSTAKYSDGVPRKWQHRADSFEFSRLEKVGNKVRKCPRNAPTATTQADG